MRARLSAIAHRGRAVAAPISSARLDGLVDIVAPPPGAQLLDLGCGKAELLVRLLAANPGAHGVGVDLASDALDAAAQRAEEIGVADCIELIESDADAALEPEADASEAMAARERAAIMRDSYLAWRRRSMGFVVVIARRPA